MYVRSGFDLKVAPANGSCNGTYATPLTKAISSEFFSWYYSAILSQCVDIIPPLISSGRTVVNVSVVPDARKCRVAE